MIQVGKFNVRIVPTGFKFGRNDVLVNDKAPMVEFYDSRYNHEGWQGRGQFVSRYFISTLLEDAKECALSLDGGIPEWTVSAEDMKTVRQYIAKFAGATA